MSLRLKTPVRLAIVVGVAGLVYLLNYQVRAMLEPGHIVLPDWDLAELPLQFEGWRGEASELDERLFRRIGADAVADRVYENREGGTVSAHTALFTNFNEGITVHSPARCYRAAGWEQRDTERRTLTVEGLPDITVDISTWQREGRRVKVLYWYQLGDRILLDRTELGGAYVALAGRETWPAMTKVMLETPGDRRQEADMRLLDVGRHIRRWLHERTASQPAPDDAPPAGEAA